MSGVLKSAINVALLSCVFLLLLWWLPHSKATFAAWFPHLTTPLYTRQSFTALLWSHIQLVGASSLFSIVVGVILSIVVTRAWGKSFQPLLASISAIGQTFPPAAVLAIAVPIIGFGFMPALFALIIYGMLPILENAIRGLEDVPNPTREAAKAMGMNPWQQLWKMEIPLALPIMLAGIRSSVLINIGTATIGSTVGAQTLGTPIIAGLVNNNPAFVIQGALLVAMLAIFVDALFNCAEKLATRHYRI